LLIPLSVLQYAGPSARQGRGLLHFTGSPTLDSS
jgi:hypothetical protein